MVSKQAVVAAFLPALLAGMAAGRTVLAQEAGRGRPEVVVKVTLMKEVVVRDAQGRERVQLRKVSSTGPGDVLVYRISYTNRGDAAAHEPRVVDPIPKGTLLVPGSWEAPGADFAVSIDGGRTFKPYPVRRRVTLADGTTVEKEVDLSRYTHLRWTSHEPLPPGETRSAVFKVRVR